LLRSSPCYIAVCLIKEPFVDSRLSHLWQANGFSALLFLTLFLAFFYFLSELEKLTSISKLFYFLGSSSLSKSITSAGLFYLLM